MVETEKEAMAETKVAMKESKVQGFMEAKVKTKVEATEKSGVVHAMEENKWLWRRMRRLWRQNGRKN